MLPSKIENPWDIRSLYEFQYFNCPACHFKTEYFKTQDFVDHACTSHPESTNYLRSIDDGSMDDVEIPWETTVSYKMFKKIFKNEQQYGFNIFIFRVMKN